MRSTKFFAVVLIIVILTGIFSLSPAITSLVTSIVIGSTGQISATQVNAKSGYPQDIQAAVDWVAAVKGGTVYVPAGTWNWTGQTVTVPGGVSVIAASGTAGCTSHPSWTVNTASVIIYNNITVPSSEMFTISGNNSRISGIQFEATPPANSTAEAADSNCVAIGVSGAGNVSGVRIDHCTFINFCAMAVGVTTVQSGGPTNIASALIDHCVINNTYKMTPDPLGSGWLWGYGFYVGGWDTWWNDTTAPITSFLGQFDTIPSGFPVLYVEDCAMSYCRHAVDAIQGGWIVCRYCYINHPYPTYYGMLDEHGTGPNAWPSARGFEFYDNTVVAEPTDDSEAAQVWLRGGGGVVFNNTFLNVATESQYYGAIMLNNETTPGELDETLHNVWIWGNTIDEGVLVMNGSGASFVQNVEYFLRAPTLAQDGFAYTPYPYPHPLTLKAQP